MRKLSALMLLSSVALAACSGRDVSAPAGADVEAWTGEMPISDPWLREQLPAGALAYMRVPHPLGLMAIPKGNLLDAALRSEANIRNLMDIQQGLAENLADDFPLFAGPPFRLLADNLRSPIEATGSAMPVPWVMIAMTLDLRSNAAFEALMAELAETPPVPPLAGPLDAEGFGQLLLDQPIFVHFDAATGRLALYGGLVATRAAFEAALAPPAAAVPHPMRALESQIDASGQGYFAWVDTAQVLAMAPLMLPPETGQILRASGTDQMRALALGAGVANGKGRLKLIADVGTNRAARPLPVVDNRISATSVGDPRSLFLFSIPSPAEFARLEGLALSYLPPEARTEWPALKTMLADRIGVSIEEILLALGPELISFSDQAGDFAGLRVRDPALFDDVLTRLAASAGVGIEERSVEGRTIRHVSLPGNFGIPEAALPGEAGVWMGMLGRVRSRLYWVADGDYVYLAGMPQLLIDRARLGPDTGIADWLGETQRVDMSSSFLAATGSVANLPKLMYQFYVGMMQGIADLVEVEYDVFAMPTATELGLPERGTLGFSVNLGEPYLSLELTYESHPAEVLLGGGGMAAAAAVGIMAAIAIPAYQDYTIRTQVSEGLNLAAAAKAAVAEAYLNRGVAAADRAAAGMSPNATDTEGAYVQSIDVVDGEIFIRYGNAAHPRIADGTVVLTPYGSADDTIVWACGRQPAPQGLDALGAVTRDGATTVMPQYLPSACRP